MDESGEAESKTGGESSRVGSQHNVMPCAFVVGVLTRNWRDYVCSHVPREAQESAISSTPGWLIVTPWDRRIPRIRIFTSEPSKLIGVRLVTSLIYSLPVHTSDCKCKKFRFPKLMGRFLRFRIVKMVVVFLKSHSN